MNIFLVSVGLLTMLPGKHEDPILLGLLMPFLVLPTTFFRDKHNNNVWDELLFKD